MKVPLLVLGVLLVLAVALVVWRYWRGTGGVQEVAAPLADGSLYDLEARTLDGEPADLGRHRGRVALVVNVASRCGFTPQYEALEALYRELSPRGLVVLGFPSNDFLNQEPGAAAEIREFCTTRFDISFPLFEKVSVKGRDQHPVYRFLTRQLDAPSWNFTKYLVDRRGRPRYRFGPRVEPGTPQLRRQLERLLAEE
jgi:glutathione peroxidase